MKTYFILKKKQIFFLKKKGTFENIFEKKQFESTLEKHFEQK